jgi:hypothetical protein
VNRDGVADLYLETLDGAAYMISPQVPTIPKSPITRDSYRSHLNYVSDEVADGRWWTAVQASIRLTTGLSHNWVLPPHQWRYPWMDAAPPRTDCVIDLERTLAELHNGRGDLIGFQQRFNAIQFYDLTGKERTDFFEAEAVPHLVRLGLIQDITAPLCRQVLTHQFCPRFDATTDKAVWFRNKTGTEPTQALPKWQQSIAYLPFEEIVVMKDDGRLALAPRLSVHLPEVAIFDVVNQGRVLLGTEVVTSHVGYLMHDRAGSVYVQHSTPTTDLGLATMTAETLERFLLTRYVVVRDGVPVRKDSNAMGLQIFSLEKPTK